MASLSELPTSEVIDLAKSYLSGWAGIPLSDDIAKEVLSRLDVALAAVRQATKERDAQKSKVEALAAEVQAIRWASGQVYARGYNHGHLNTVDELPYAEEKDLVIRGGETLCEYIDPDHCGVATDAILAEVEARSLEVFAEKLLETAKIWEGQGVNEESVARSRFSAISARYHAQQLREEAGK